MSTKKSLRLPIGTRLTEAQMMDAMTLIMNCHVDADEIAAFLTNLSQRGECVDEITGAARVLRSKAAMIEAPDDALDCCGTGGDGIGTYNISTAVALVAAACGVPVAKHGNRAASSKSGAADVLEALGVNLNITDDKLEQALKELNFCFLMAPRHHQAMKHVAPIRKSLGFRTIFNLLGPLANPARTKYQLIGVYDKKWLVPMAETLHRLGTKKAWLVHGSDGLDEITTTGETYIAVLEKGHVTEKVLSPDDFGVKIAKPQNLLGGEAGQNATALLSLLNGDEGAYRDIVLVNTAAVLNIHRDLPLSEGMNLARQAIDESKALDVLNNYKDFVA